MKHYRVLLSSIILCILGTPLFGWSKNKNSGFFLPNNKESQTMVLGDEDISYTNKTYKIRVPDNVFKIEIQIDDSSADLDIYMNYDRTVDDYDDCDYKKTKDLFNERLSISRFSYSPLETGEYYIKIVYALEEYPRVDNVKIKEINFDLTVNFTTIEEPHLLIPGESYSTSLKSGNGEIILFAIDVESGEKFLRIDLFNTMSDFDFYVRYGEPAFSKKDADYYTDNYIGQEHMVIEKRSRRDLKKGRYYISVFDNDYDSPRDKFSILVSYDKEPSPLLTIIPDFPKINTLFEKVQLATVEVLVENGAGSGCLVSEEGYILTGLHVIRNDSGKLSDNIYIAFNLSNLLPAKELYKAEVIEILENEDLALIKINRGLYDQAISDFPKFPFYKLALGQKVLLGQNITFLGYPQLGSEGSRASISLTKGYVSGFDTYDFGYLIKSDGEINSGNSGGAAFNDNFELIGLPMSVISKDAGQIAYIHPISLIPQSWLKLIGQ